MSVHGEFHRYREALLDCVRAHPGPAADAWIAGLSGGAEDPEASLSQLAEQVRALVSAVPDPPAARLDPASFEDLKDRLGAIVRLILG